MPEDSYEAPELHDIDVNEREKDEEWEKMSDEEKLERLKDV